MRQDRKERRAMNAIMKALDLDPDQYIKIGFGQAKRKHVWYDVICSNGFDNFLRRVVEVHCHEM